MRSVIVWSTLLWMFEVLYLQRLLLNLKFVLLQANRIIHRYKLKGVLYRRKTLKKPSVAARTTIDMTPTVSLPTDILISDFDGHS